MKLINYFCGLIKSFLFFIIKEFFSFFIKLALFLVLLSGVFTFLLNRETNKNKIIKNNFYVKIDLSQKFKEKSNTKTFFDEKALNFYSLLANIEDITLNTEVKGLILNLDDISLNYSQIEELSQYLLKLKEYRNIDIISYMEEVDKKNFYLASFTNKIFMPKTNSTVVNISPYFRESFYKKDFLDKLGVKFNIVNTGNYKSYGEDLASSKMSKEAREDSTRILKENYENFLDKVSNNLRYDRNKMDNLIKNGDLVAASSKDLYEQKLISGYMYWSEIVNMIGEDHIVDINDYALNYFTFDQYNSKNKIYIMALEGSISDEDILDNTFINPSNVINSLNKLEKDDSVKGLVIRVDSPGGSALASDKISNRLKEFKKKKPVYISMGGVAASGGYYIASNANKIFASESTITGSIGVVSVIPNFSELLNKTGINNEKISEGEFADLYSSDEMTKEKYNKILKSNLKVYDDFLNEVSNGRRIDRAKLQKIAEGRIWTGREAIELGLVDEIGGLSDTVYSMIEDLELGDDYNVIFMEDKMDVKNLYKKYSKFISSSKTEKLSLMKNSIFDENLYNKPILYMPYEIFE